MEQCLLMASAVIISAFLLTGATSLRCYQCYINPRPGEFYNTTPLCVHFDYSSKYVVECPFSTMCMKQELQLDIQNGVKINGVQRDCAVQKYEGQELINGKWIPTTDIKEPYQEGCETVDVKGQKGPSTKYCYCRNDLCNSSPPSNHEGYTDVMGVIVVFNLMKYINGLR